MVFPVSCGPTLNPNPSLAQSLEPRFPEKSWLLGAQADPEDAEREQLCVCHIAGLLKGETPAVSTIEEPQLFEAIVESLNKSRH